METALLALRCDRFQRVPLASQWRDLWLEFGFPIKTRLRLEIQRGVELAKDKWANVVYAPVFDRVVGSGYADAVEAGFLDLVQHTIDPFIDQIPQITPDAGGPGRNSRHHPNANTPDNRNFDLEI